jgi:drug/metabolite transporter (DMT)-like permease
MLSSHLLGVLLALSAAGFYGSADFYGGLASRRISPYQVMVITSLIGLLLMAALGVLWGESWPSSRAMFWATSGGIVGTLGLIALYRGLVSGNAATVSPISGVIGAAIPVVFGTLTAGLPGIIRLAGFAVAVPGIWLVTLAPSVKQGESRNGFWLGAVAGMCFGIYFVCIAHIGRGEVFGPLAVSKAAAGLLALLLVSVARHDWPSFRGNPAALLAGALDPLANALFLMSSHYTRIDVTAVLASLYPAGTVLLSWLVLKEPISRMQWLGVALCLGAIVLITL